MPAPENYIPALRFRFLTPLYDVLAGATTRERRFRGQLLNQAALQPGWNVLDIGCGTGTLCRWAKRAQPQAQIVGLDGDPQILAIARRKAARAGTDVEFVEGLSYRLPFGAGSFDCVLSSLVFHHLQPGQKTATLTEIRRILKPGGFVHIADWGAARGLPSRLQFCAIQLLDGFATTGDHVDGKLPEYMSDAGLEDVAITGDLLTVFGHLSLFRGRATATRAGS